MEDKIHDATFHNDHLIMSNGIVLSYRSSMSRMLDLQRKHGTRNVFYCPPPSLLSKQDEHKEVSPDEEFSIVVVSGVDTDIQIVYRLLTHMRSRYKKITEICVQPNDITLHNYVQNSSFIFVLGATSTVATSVLSTGRPFCFLNPVFGDYINFLREHKLNTNVIETKHYSTLKNNFRDLYSRTEEMTTYIPTVLDELKKHIIIARSVINDVQKISNHTPSQLDPKLHAWFGNELHHDNPPLKEISDKMVGHGTPGGVYFDIAVVRTYLHKETAHLYPWLGIIEVPEPVDVQHLFNIHPFIVSLNHCCGLFTVSDKMTEVVSGLLKQAGKSIEVRTVGVFTYDLPAEEMFSIDKFSENPKMTTCGKIVSSIGMHKINEKMKGVKSDEEIETIFSHLTNDLFVCTNVHIPMVGVINCALSRRTPTVVLKDCHLSTIFDTTYPLILDRVQPTTIHSVITLDTIRTAQSTMLSKSKIVKLEDWMRKITCGKSYAKIRMVVSQLPPHPS